MHSRYKKVYCCTPVSFAADENVFFIRDTGLISRTLVGMGVESKCIMPLPYHGEDVREWILRTEYENLESVSWWKSLEIDALVLYSWGAPRYRRIAKAVHEAGIRLWIHMDTGGNFEGNDWPELPWYKKITRFLKVKAQDYFRAQHLDFADVITMSEPTETIMRHRLFYGARIANKIHNMPAPVNPGFHPHLSVKRIRKVICVGRWSDSACDEVKRPSFLMKTAEQIALLDKKVLVEIYGRTGKKIQSHYNSLPLELRERIILRGRIRNEKLPLVYSCAQVAICTSRSESSHIASAEAMCCGCSVVVTPRTSLNILHWYTSKESGRISEEDTPESLAAAIHDELNAWERGDRDPFAIAEAWQPYFHVDKVMNQIFKN